MLTRNQHFANKVFMQVSEIAKLTDQESKRYGSMAHKLPVLIRTAGLTQALAFVESRGKDEQKRLLDHLAEVVEAGTRGELLQRSRTSGLGDYMRLTQDTLAALLWYKRFAQSVLKVEANDDGEVIS